MNKNLLILGAGGYGSVVKEIAAETGSFSEIAFLDDSFGEENGRCSVKLIGKLADCAMFSDKYSYAIVAIGNPRVRREWTMKLRESGFKIPAIVSPDAYVSPTAEIREGAVVEPKAAVMANAVIDTCSLISAGAVVNHNSFVSEFCHVDCCAVIMTAAIVPADTLVPSGEVFIRE